MSGDYSRKFFDKKKHYSSVQQQQGRVLLDSDWNEQSDILQNRIRTETSDVIGKTGVPKEEGGFKIDITPDGGDLTISPGKIYVDGVLCELEMESLPTTYLNQPHYPVPDNQYFTESPPSSPPANPPLSPPGGTSLVSLKDGTYLAYLDVWEREINYIDDPLIKEVALGDADTTTRLQVVWQVKLLEVTPLGAEVSCNDNYAEWIDKTQVPTGKLNARTVQADLTDNPCLTDATAGYRRLENQLYRIEVHKSGTESDATFKWSRDNASVQTKITHVDSSVITVADLGKDDVLGFAPGNWVEIIDEDVALNYKEESLFQIDSIAEDSNEITLKTSANSYKGKKNLKLCRWDQTGTSATNNGIEITSDWMKIEDGIEIQFSEGSYNDGDYWLIPARTATGEIEWPPFEIPNTTPIAQPPKGIKHSYCKLSVIEVNQGIGTLTDCRKLFPSLSKLEAEDIWYNNTHCGINQANTVQEAIDMLCAVTDIRDHNKYVHGKGVVCGLKVICGPQRTEVIVEKGYAIDCEGNVIQVRKQNEIPYNIVSQAAAQNLIDNNGDGHVSLSINSCTATGPDLFIEEFVKKDFWDEVLEGTLIKDFYDDSIQKLIDFVKKNFSFNLSTQAPLDISQKRLTTLVNLLTQLINSGTLPYSFVSGTEIKDRSTIDCSNPEQIGRYEDQILWCLYKELRTILDSETHCAIFDGDALFPNYEIDAGLHTIFGPAFKLHYRIKMHPNGNYAYTFGFDNRIFAYDLTTQEYIQCATFPSSNNLIIQDFVISNQGNALYALGILDNKDSVFAAAEINSDGLINWGKTSVCCSAVFHTLAINSLNKIYCIQINTGLYEIKSIGEAGFTIDSIQSFNATGMILLSADDRYAFVAEMQTHANVSNTFSHISQFDLTDNTVAKVSFAFEGTDLNDDIKLVDDVLYITGTDPAVPGQRILGGYNVTNGNSITSINLPSTWLSRMIPVENPDGGTDMLITQCDSCRVLRIILGNTPVLLTDYRIPTQLFPMDIAGNPGNNKAYVINFLLNTLTDIDLQASFDTVNVPDYTNEPPVIISDYRDGVLEAFGDLLSHFLQYLKDGFTDQFLVDCPECNETDKVYLASVEIRNNMVYNINNFSKRNYVKTPELWEYWLSTVPILPIFKQKFKEFCGKVL